MDLRTRERLAKLVRMLGSSHAGERENARSAIDEILRRHGRSWAELPDLMQPTGQQNQRPAAWDDDDDGQPAAGSAPVPLDRLVSMLREYLQLEEHDYLAVALWIIHTYLFSGFMVSPRLALVWIASTLRCCATRWIPMA